MARREATRAIRRQADHRLVLRSPSFGLAALAAGVPSTALSAELEASPFFVLAAIDIFLETAAAFRRHGTVRHGQGRCVGREDPHAVERFHGGTAPRARLYRHRRVLAGCHAESKKGAAGAAPHHPSGTSHVVLIELPPLRSGRDDARTRLRAARHALAAPHRHRVKTLECINAANPVPVTGQ